MPFDPITLAAQIEDPDDLDRATLDALATDVGFDVAFLAVPGSLPVTVGLDPLRIGQALASRAYDEEILPWKRAAAAAGGVAVDTRVFGEAAVSRMAYHRDLAAPVGGKHSLMAWLTLRGRLVASLMLGRTGGAFSDRDVDHVARLVGPLSVARASYGVPWVSRPLPDPASRSALARARGWLSGERVCARIEGRDGALVVRDRAGHREMVVEGARGPFVWSRARIDDPRRSGWFYVDLFHLAAVRARRRRRALFIGCGGAVAVRQFAETYPGVRIDLVEIEARVLDLAFRWYDLAAIPHLATHVADGVELVRGSPPAQWDVVIVDAYGDADLPPAFASHGFFRDVARVLCPGGAMALNAIGTLGGESAVQAVERAARAALAEVRLVPVLDRGEACSPAAVRNVVVVGSRPDVLPERQA
jgi:hypothetical protein